MININQIKLFIILYKNNSISYTKKYNIIYKINTWNKYCFIPLLLVASIYFMSFILLLVLAVNLLIHFKIVEFRQVLAKLAVEENVNSIRKGFDKFIKKVNK